MKSNRIIVFLIAVFCYSSTMAQSEVMVTSLDDDNGTGTLRWAINTANTDMEVNKITFKEGLEGTLSLASDLPHITNNLTIIGPGAKNVVISGEGAYRMFVVNKGFSLDISGFTLTDSADNYNDGTIFAVSGSAINASEITVTGVSNQTAFWSKGDNSSITISNSIFENNSATLFRSYWGSTPSFTSDNENDYTNRITITGSSFISNRGLIFSTEHYVKIDNCTFRGNYDQIASFKGVNRYQILNSKFVNNTGRLLFTFSSKIGDTPSWGEDTLGTNNTLFDGNLFQGNTGTIINTGGGFKHDSKTTITNNIFVNNGNNWYGNPIETSGNQQNNFITSVTLADDEGTVVLTLNKSLIIQSEDKLH
ncbi:hypothetical protein [Arenibacter sp. ARW7G5Y1]|uniref:hypothetical protein n=1 Tax=Arenibacter sp. ARW7G5Y1 TaxID=2135619 RepID=UPI000D9A68D8|nr:hypothetical protein [Arenibacter sp. ARW7G5Y1]PXX22657.1 hypothetical protein C7972_12321 [Arenibacter sp. ARW7G5Y1]